VIEASDTFFKIKSKGDSALVLRLFIISAARGAELVCTGID
jgi:hypothetical protein